MGGYSSKCTVVEVGRPVDLEERRLEDPCRQDDLVIGRGKVGTDG
jgi:hypothetical protein